MKPNFNIAMIAAICLTAACYRSSDPVSEYSHVDVFYYGFNTSVIVPQNYEDVLEGAPTRGRLCKRSDIRSVAEFIDGLTFEPLNSSAQIDGRIILKVQKDSGEGAEYYGDRFIICDRSNYVCAVPEERLRERLDEALRGAAYSPLGSDC